MQPKSFVSEKQRELTVPIGDDVLARASEGTLLRLVVTILELWQPGLNGVKELALLIEKSPQYVNAAINDETCIGGLNWKKIQKRINLRIYSRWFRIQEEKE
jgi:hypothetical protein